MIILGVVGFFVLTAIGAGIYFYNYYVFKEIRVCVGEGEDFGFPCDSRADCLDLLNFDDNAVEGAPPFIKASFEDILNSAVYCEGNCFVARIRGIDYETGNLQELDSCLEGEEEFVMEIRGKEGLEILEWMKNRT